jgi:oxygen-dependent protoporphyrinogen oxidase
VTRPPKVAVIGGGISGLAAAHRLVESGRELDLVLLEAGDRLGGKLRTVDLDGLNVEGGADSFVVRKPWAVDLCRRLGLEDRVIIPATGGASVWTDRGLVTLPERSAFGVPGSVRDLTRWPGLSSRGKARALADLVLPSRRSREDESLASLARRRLGPGAAGLLVEPILAGMHAGDPERLSVLATFPELAAWERDHGSLIRAARRALKKEDEPGRGRKPLFASLWGGLELLVRALAQRIEPDRIHLDAPVSSLSASGTGYGLVVSGGAEAVDAIVLATPAFESARLLAVVNAEAADELSRIPYASTAVVLLAYPPGTADRLPEQGTGFVVPAGDRMITACTWYSRKWPNEAFGSRAVVRCYVGRAGAEQALERSDRELASAADAEVQAARPVGAAPEAWLVVRWDRSMPQYEVGHLDRLARIEAALAAATPGIFLSGSAYRGIGIADCVRRGRDAADQALAHLGMMRDSPVEPEVEGREAITWTS